MIQRQKSYSALNVLCAALLAAAPLAASHAGEADAAHARRFITQTDRLIVKYKDAKGPSTVAAVSSARQAILDRAGQQFGATLRALRATAGGAHVFQMNHSMTLEQARQLAADLKSRDSNVEYAEPDRIMTAQATPTDPSYGQQWDLFESIGGINAPSAWDKSTGAGINVAVIDTGYRPHVDLQGQILQGYDFITNTTIANDGDGRDSDASDPGDWTVAGQCSAGNPSTDQSSSWHGTHVAGTIAARANNGQGIAGIAYNAKIVPARVLGKCGGYTSDIADAIVWSSGGTVANVPTNANPARVLNLSLGGSGACDTTTQNAINSARSRGAVVVVAAGNSNADASTSAPANCAGVIAVAATNRSGGKASYSNTGSIVTIAAPGGDIGAGILSTLNSGTTTPGADSYASYMGTSMATPHIAGVAALMLSANPNLTPDDVAAKLKSTARAFPAACSGCGVGIVDAAAAVNAALGSTSTTPAPTTWTACANEGGTCNFSGTMQVRYGANGTYVTKTLTGPVACNNNTFGGDPVPYVAKSCSYQDTSTSTPTPAPTPAPTTWTACANEGGTCNFSGTMQVRYGANGTYVTKTLTGPVACNNNTFGGDPVYGTAKSCSYQAPATVAPVTWTTCANEGGVCAFSGTRQVRYGANNSFITKTFTGSATCSNDAFGGDPIYGTAKSCSYSSVTQ